MIVISILKKIRNEFLRKFVYKKYQIGSGFHCGIRVRIWGKRKIKIGRNFYIGRDSCIESDVVIGNNVMLGNRVAIIGRYDHNYQQIGTPVRLASQIRDENYNWIGMDYITTIEDDVWIGYGVTIMGGVTIKTGSIIAAHSLVTKDVEPYSIYGGVPAEKIKDRFNTPEELKQHIEIYTKEYKP